MSDPLRLVLVLVLGHLCLVMALLCGLLVALTRRCATPTRVLGSRVCLLRLVALAVLGLLWPPAEAHTLLLRGLRRPALARAISVMTKTLIARTPSVPTHLLELTSRIASGIPGLLLLLVHTLELR